MTYILVKYIKIFTAALLLVLLISCGNDAQDKTTITLGIIDIHQSYEVDYTTSYVGRFNLENENYQIEIVKYTGDDLLQLRTELISGRGPDIIYSLYFEDSIFTPLMNRGLLADLWPYIDADPDIDRGDFFQNILHAMQSPDGSLQIIANQFSILTAISIPEIIADLDSFTTSKFLEMIQSAIHSGVTYPMGDEFSGSDFFIFMLSYVDLGVIDFDGGTYNYENQVIYDLLKLASILPDEIVSDSDYSLYARMIRGEQLFRVDSITSPFNIAKYETLLGEFSVLGLPSGESGTYGAIMRSNIGLNANSDYPDVAWSFIRRFLLSGSHLDIISGLPIRQDLFDEHIAEAMDNRTVAILKDGPAEVKLQPLTQKGANQLREIIESVSFISRPNDTVTNIVTEVLPSFLVGSRTAEEVARIIQNRVQMYLHERS